MNSIGIYEVDHLIKGWKFTNPVNVITKLNDNIIGIDFMHRNKLIYDVNTRQVKFSDAKMNTICTTKQVTIPAMTSSMITTKFHGETNIKQINLRGHDPLSRITNTDWGTIASQHRQQPELCSVQGHH
jgi:hypothetical protein